MSSILIARLFFKLAEESPAKPNPSSTVPFLQDPDFVDRDILAEVDKKCSKPSARVALVGLGGVGKSQIAIEYSYRVRKEFPQTWIFWVHASNAARFEQGYRTIADRIQLPRQNEPTANILQLVSNWLCDETNGQWIMILDNADDFTVFSYPRKGRLKSDSDNEVGEALKLITFLPQTPNGSILVTSRSEDAAGRLTGSHHNIIKVQPMDEGCALLLLRKKLRCEFNEDKAIELVRALDFMPLAISQAAAYTIQRAPRTTVARYLEDFHKSDRNRENLLNMDSGELRRDSNASNCIITTWQISFEYIRRKRPSATRLLSLMSFFDRQGIPESLIHRYEDKEASSDTKLKAKVDIELEDDGGMEFEEDVFTLKSYSLITTNVNGDQFEMHRLVQFSTKRWLDLNGELNRWNNKYIMIISEAFPGTYDYKNWRDFQTLFPHAKTAFAYRPVETRFFVYWCKVLDKAGWYATTQGNYSTAEKMSRQALDGREEVQDEEHADTLMSVSNLALALRYQGKYEAAEKMSRRALDGREKILGKEHPYTLTSVSNLALVLRNQGKHKAAEGLNRRALDGYEKILGEKHLYTLTSVGNLASVLQNQGKYEAAEKMMRRVLDGHEKVLGEEHPETLTSVSNLALMLQDQGKHEAAEKMNRRALDGREKVLGEEHPHTLASLSNLALVLQDQGKHEAAEKMIRRALDGHEKILGEEHPDTLASLSNLTSVAAEKMNRRALDRCEKVLGEENPHTLTIVSNLASVLRDQGKYEVAKKMNQQVLDGREKILGEEHPDTLTSVYCLAYVLHKQKQYNHAARLYERSCTGFQKVLGINHPTTLACSNHYSSLVEEMKTDRDSSVEVAESIQ